MVSTDGDVAEFDLVGSGESYEPGTHTLRAIDGEDTIGEMKVDLRPDIDLTEYLWAENHPEMDWPDKNNWETHAALRLENTGSGPALLTGTRWGNAPFTFRNDGRVAEYDHNEPLPPGETTTVYSKAPVYEVSGGLSGGAVDCGELDTEQFELTAVVEPGDDQFFTQTVEYGGERLDCDLNVVDGGS
ncbi:hypothetical protein [Halorientalis sp. IM1011]|uniref:hypothetical protein n=1 Tax=Halorientalis sp. IM1011 TaxID=1932360 RepID=UPI0020A48D3D|nr:hypothetical protein [Halorientalis sp. IM1011]